MMARSSPDRQGDGGSSFVHRSGDAVGSFAAPSHATLSENALRSMRLRTCLQKVPMK